MTKNRLGLLAGVSAIALTSGLACGGDNGSTAGPDDNNDAGGTTAVDGGEDASRSPVVDGSAGSDASQRGDTSSPPPVDGSMPSSTYPAFPIDAPSVVKNSGNIMTNPVIVTVTWSADPNTSIYQAYGDAIGGSQYWSDVNSEYGVGPSVSGAANHVAIATAPPATMSDSSIDKFVDQNVGKNGWPAAAHDTLFAIYIPQSMKFTFGTGANAQDACDPMVGIFGYHSQSNTAGANYAIILDCSMFSQFDVLSTSSHEFNEAATDPDGQTGYVTFDTDHLSFEYLNGFQDELGDACESYLSSNYTTTEPGFSYPVQRQWSNKASLAGHNACQPAADEGPYFNVTLFPAQETTIHADLTSQQLPASTPTKGFLVTLNQPYTFQVGFISDADTGGPWTLSADIPADTPLTDDQGNYIANGTGTVTIDKTTGVDGDKANVTVTATTMGPTGVLFLEFYSKGTPPANDAGPTPAHYMPVLFGTK